MKNFFKNQYVTGIIIGFVVAILIEYIFPSLPEGKILLKYFLEFLLIILRYVFPIIGIWIIYKYRTLDKRFVLEIALYFSFLLFAISGDVSLYLSNNNYARIITSNKITDKELIKLIDSDKEQNNILDKLMLYSSKSSDRELDLTMRDSDLIKTDSSLVVIIEHLISRIESLESKNK